MFEHLKSGGQLSEPEKKERYAKWKKLVNMSKSELEAFYNSEEGKAAGLSAGEAAKQGIDSGRESARWIMKMKSTNVSNWTPEMWRWAGKQISFISRMSGNKGSLYDDKGRKTRKHTSLLIWGHNPKKASAGAELENNDTLLNKTYKKMDNYTYNELDVIEKLARGMVLCLYENVFMGTIENPQYIGSRYITCEVLQTKANIRGNVQLLVLECSGVNPIKAGNIITRPTTNVYKYGRFISYDEADSDTYLKKGGELDPDNKEIKEYYEHKSGSAGGMLVGKRHSEGGIKAVNKSTDQPLEMEGGEVVITRDAVSDPTHREFEGKQMTNREILSAINQSGGGVAFAEGGKTDDLKCMCSGKEYKYGGKTMKDYEIVKKIKNGYGSKEAIEKGMKVEDKEHGDTFRALKNGEITYEQFLKRLVTDHLSENPNYYDKH